MFRVAMLMTLVAACGSPAVEPLADAAPAGVSILIDVSDLSGGAILVRGEPPLFSTSQPSGYTSQWMERDYATASADFPVRVSVLLGGISRFVDLPNPCTLYCHNTPDLPLCADLNRVQGMGLIAVVRQDGTPTFDGASCSSPLGSVHGAP